MNNDLFNRRMLAIRNEELKVAKDDNFKLLKQLIRQQEVNRQLLLYVSFLEQKIIDMQKEK